MKERILHYLSAACYLKVKDKVLMLKYNKKWGQVYTPPGGKLEANETPLECVIREFKEETNLTLINPRLQGISYWKDSAEGIIFIFTAEDYEGTLEESIEGSLEWINLEDLPTLNQFSQNKIFTPYLFKDSLFEGKFYLDDNCQVINYEIKEM